MGLYENVRDIAKTKGYSVNKLEQELGFARSSINKFNKNTPSAEKLQQIADLLGVTVDYLMTGKETVGSCEYDISNLMKHTENEQALLENFSKLNFKGEEEAIKRVRELVFVPEYTESQEELWKLVPGSINIIKKSVEDNGDFIDSAAEPDTSSTYTINIADMLTEENSYDDPMAKEQFDYKEPVAAHERTDVEVTDEMRKHDDDLMDDDDFWNK